MRPFLIIIIILLTVATTSAQWQYGGKQIGIGQPEVYPCLAPDGSGGVYVVWQGCTDALDSSYVMLNHFDTSGTPLFGEGGIAVARSPLYNLGEAQIAPDGLGGCFVLWGQILPVGGTPMYLQRISYYGEQLWSENVRLLYRSGYVNSYYDGLQILADTSFGVIAISKFGAGYTCILGQRIDYNGNLLWDSSGVIIRDTTANWNDDVNCLKLCRSGDRFYCTWIDERNFGHSDAGIYLQQFNRDGYIYFGLGDLPVSTNGDEGLWDERQSIQIVSDGTGGVVVGWVSSGWTLKAQRISQQGNFFWQANGLRLINNNNSNRFGLGLYKIADLFWAIVLGGRDFRYQKISPNGTMVYGDTGRAFIDTVHAVSINRDTLYFLNRIWRTFYCSKKDTSWNEYWANHPFFHGTGDRSFEILPDGFGGLYAVINDYRDWNTDWVILQRVYPDGYIGGDTVGIADEKPPLPKKALSLEAYPNPFNSNTTIKIGRSTGKEAELRIYDIEGRLIKILKTTGQTAVWDATDNANQPIPSGIYFAKISEKADMPVLKMILLK
jgi:hypothetical protein